MNVRELIPILRRRKLIILTSFFLTVIIITIVTFLQKEVYRATATVIADAENAEIKSTPYKYYIATQKEIIHSRRTAYYVIKNLKLYRLKEFANSKDPVGYLLRKLRVEPIKGTVILKISVDNRNPKLASFMANEFARVYVASNKALKMRLSNQAQAWLREEVDKQKRKLTESELKRDIETNERILQALLDRLEQASVSGKMFADNTRVQDLADVPVKPVSPNKGLNIALSVAMGLAGGIAMAFFRDYTDTIIREPYEIADILGVPLLGSVPKIRPDGKNIRNREDIDLIVKKDSYSLASEAYRAIRTNLLFSLSSSLSESIVITSSVPREGKTTAAISLSLMIAHSGESVLLVDSNMRKPRVHVVFNERNEPGLSQFLLEENDFDSIIKDPGVDNMRIVTAGKCTHKPAELLYSKNMKLFLEKAGSRFSKIILDTPPVSLVADAQILSSMATGVILIAEGGRTTKDLLARSKKLLEKVDAKIIGIIVNNM